jgi:RNA polymerase sigma-70 factor (ECF subfamily)
MKQHMEQSPKFATTHWSVVLLAGGARDNPKVQDALSRLCSTYWYPLYVFIRRHGHTADEAEELTQEFFARILEQDILGSVDRRRGKFRTFLLSCCQHFLANQRDFSRAEKRGGGRLTLSLDFPCAEQRYRAEPTLHDTAEKLFEGRWALTLLEQTLTQLQREYQADGNDACFDLLKSVLTGGKDTLTYSQIGATLGMKVDAVRKAAQRLRQRYRELLRQNIADTVDATDRVDDEIRDLFAALA